MAGFAACGEEELPAAGSSAVTQTVVVLPGPSSGMVCTVGKSAARVRDAVPPPVRTIAIHARRDSAYPVGNLWPVLFSTFTVTTN